MSNFMKVLLGAEVCSCRWSAGRTDMKKLIGAFRKFCEKRLIKFSFRNLMCGYVFQQLNHFLFTLFLCFSVGFPTVGEPCFIYRVINKLYHCLCCLEVWIIEAECAVVRCQYGCTECNVNARCTLCVHRIIDTAPLLYSQRHVPGLFLKEI